MERGLAARTDRLIAVSDEVRDDLVALGVAAPEQFDVVALGFDLSPFQVAGDERALRRCRFRAELGIPDGARVVTLVARLVAIKRVDRFLRVAARLADRDELRFVVVGDGDLHDRLRASDESARLGARVTWTGFRRDIPDVCFGSDVVVLTSDNEGTPVVTTRVGGVGSVVHDGVTGLVVDTADERGMAAAIGRLLDDPPLAARFGRAGAGHAGGFTVDRLVERIDGLYRDLLARRCRA
jgi:glycosyltransferase involved in cell wall biosynthesis